MQLAPAWVGRKIVKITTPSPNTNPRKHLEPSPTAIKDAGRILSMDRYGKFIWLQQETGGTKIHLSSTGWFTPKNNEALRASVVDPIMENFLHTVNEKGVRFRLHLDDDQVWNYHDPRTWGRMTHVEGATSMMDDSQINAMGPDWLRAPDQAAEALLKHKSRRAAKEVTCDQRLTAGLGNYLACEILHLAGIYPRRPWSEVTPEERARVVENTFVMLKASMENDNHEHWRVFLKAGQKCKSCEGGTIDLVQDGSSKRHSYFCGRCQPIGRAENA